MGGKKEVGVWAANQKPWRWQDQGLGWKVEECMG